MWVDLNDEFDRARLAGHGKAAPHRASAATRVPHPMESWSQERWDYEEEQAMGGNAAMMVLLPLGGGAWV
jgi:hypothetical protein